MSRMPLLFLALLLISGGATAATLYPFATEAQAERFERLIDELHCPVCQGQSIGDSNAELALDMRALVHELILEGHSDDDIRHFMAARYGNAVLFRPPLEPGTWLLWFAPPLLAIAGLAVAANVVARRRRSRIDSAPLNAAERERLHQLLQEGDTRQ